MREKHYQYLYGPVPSRRLGRSLGIDLVPFKTCTYDCIYCQLGRTTNKTISRQDFFPVDDILDELKDKLATGGAPDFISIAGSGEPTLHAGIGELIGKIKDLSKIPVAVLTNGSLLYQHEVHAALMQADLIIPSLDAGDEKMFHYINRPHSAISFDSMVGGLVEFTRSFSGKVWLEVLLVSGVNGMAADVRKIAAWVDKIKPERVQLNTVCRPAAEEYACAVKRTQMESLADLFSHKAEVISEDEAVLQPMSPGEGTTGEEIVQLLARRPCTLTGVCSGLGLHPHAAAKKLKKLTDEKRVTTFRLGHDVFYKITEVKVNL